MSIENQALNVLIISLKNNRNKALQLYDKLFYP